MPEVLGRVAGRGWETGLGWAPEVSCAERSQDAIAAMIALLVARDNGRAGEIWEGLGGLLM